MRFFQRVPIRPGRCCLRFCCPYLGITDINGRIPVTCCLDYSTFGGGEITFCCSNFFQRRTCLNQRFLSLGRFYTRLGSLSTCLCYRTLCFGRFLPGNGFISLTLGLPLSGRHPSAFLAGRPLLVFHMAKIIGRVLGDIKPAARRSTGYEFRHLSVVRGPWLKLQPVLYSYIPVITWARLAMQIEVLS